MISRPRRRNLLSDLFQESGTGRPHVLWQNQSNLPGQRGSLKENRVKKAWADMHRSLRRLGTRIPKVGTVATGRYKDVGSDIKSLQIFLMSISLLLLQDM